LEGVVVVVQGSAAPAAPWHSLTVTVELVTPVPRSRLLVTVTSHATASPPTLSVPLHWSTRGAATAASVIGAAALDDLVTAGAVGLVGSAIEAAWSFAVRRSFRDASASVTVDGTGGVVLADGAWTGVAEVEREGRTGGGTAFGAGVALGLGEGVRAGLGAVGAGAAGDRPVAAGGRTVPVSGAGVAD
jgi:hypothetical protein